MNSLEWRVKKLENKLLGSTHVNPTQIDRILGQSGDQKSVCDQLEQVSRLYRDYVGKFESYSRFIELYNKFKHLMKQSDLSEAGGVDELSKAELVLAYEEDLLKHFQNVKLMVDKAERVLDVQNWPDLTGFQEKLDKLVEINEDQLRQSNEIDDKTEKLIQIYNDIISSFKSNMAIWNNKLEAYENEERKLDEDE